MFFFGVITGGLIANIAWVSIVLAGRRRFGVVGGAGMAVRPTANAAADRMEWEKTRNFLYYDGTEMPVIREERYE